MYDLHWNRMTALSSKYLVGVLLDLERNCLLLFTTTKLVVRTEGANLIATTYYY